MDSKFPDGITSLATKEDVAMLKADIGNLRADFYRALWLQGASIIAVILGLLKLL